MVVQEAAEVKWRALQAAALLMVLRELLKLLRPVHRKREARKRRKTNKKRVVQVRNWCSFSLQRLVIVLVVVGSRFFSGGSKTGPELTGGNQAYPSNGYRHVKFNKVSARILFGFFYSYFGYLFIFCPEWLLGLLWPSLNVMS